MKDKELDEKVRRDVEYILRCFNETKKPEQPKPVKLPKHKDSKEDLEVRNILL